MKKVFIYLLFLGTLTKVSGQIYQDYNVLITKNDLFTNPGESMGEGEFKIENNLLSLILSGSSVLSNTLRTGIIKSLNTSPALPDMVLGPIISPTLGTTNYIASIEGGNLVFQTSNNSEQYDLDPESGSLDISQQTDLTQSFNSPLPDLYTCSSGGGGDSGTITIENGLVTITYGGGWSPTCTISTGPILDVGGGDGIELGRLMTQDGLNTLYKLKIENGYLHIYFDDEYIEHHPTSTSIDLSVQTSLTHTYSASVPALYECQGGVGGGGGSGSLNIQNGLVELNYSGGWSNTCNIKTGFIMNTGGGDGIELGVLKTQQGINTIYNLKIYQGQLQIYTDEDVLSVKDYSFNFSQLLGNNGTGSIVSSIPRPDLPLNFIMVRSYDASETLKGGSIGFFDNLGRPTQQQSKDMSTAKNWTSETRYDNQGRAALSTLSAPVSEASRFHFKTNFITNQIGQTYQNADFETLINDPSPVGDDLGTLGWYYSTQNTDAFYEGNDYQDITDRPYSRTIYSELNPGTALRTIGGNQVDAGDNNGLEDNWLQGYTFTMKAGQELTQVAAFNDLSYDTAGDTRKIIKTVGRDVHGIENVMFTDTDGKTLAAARVGGDDIYDSTVSIGEQGFVDIHVPEGFTGFTVNGVSGITTQIHNLITEQLEVGASTSLLNGFYRVSITNLEDYNPANSANTVSIDYQENYYDYSLNYYDDIGRLISSKQPLNHIETTYEYNTLGQLTSTTSPDEGTANFVYRKDGQIRFSQNEKQALANEYSYTNYDFLVRPIESGVVNGTFSLTMDGDMDNNFVGTRSEQQATIYDFLEASDSTFLNGVDSSYANPSFLAGNVVKTTNDQTTSYYSYDVYERVQWIVQDVAGLGVKTIDYEYDAITSQVNQVVYQKHTPSETFVHRYTYDPDDYSLTKVETATVISTDDTDYTEHATYNYYETGNLRSVILAEGIQQIDYVYNLAGQLKGINHPSLSATDDPGGNDNDLFGMSIDYYSNDYKRTNAFNNVTQSEDQFNGNIKGITWNTGPNLGQNPVQYAYDYNRNNWLTEANFNGNGNSTGVLAEDIVISSPGNPDQTIQAGTVITFSPGFEVTASAGTVFIAQIVEENVGGPIEAEDYRVHDITYDANGNIERLIRNKNTENGIVGSNAMDVLTYDYDVTKPNQLLQVVDAEGDVDAGDIGAQTDYNYNAIGQLVSSYDGTDATSYFYNASGLVTQVNENEITRVKFYYNDKNHRLKKESYNNVGGEPSLVTTTYYVRDASGTALAIYEKEFQDPIDLKEHTIHGASRLGIHYREEGTNGTDVYQLTDYLGNVRAVIVKSGTLAAAITSKTDYYPFGMPMPNRNDGANSYRYAFQGQEKDAETGMEAFELRLWDSRIGRWLTTDPAGQFSSPYLGMGNNPISMTDPDGGFCPECPDDIYAILSNHVYDEGLEVGSTASNGWKVEEVINEKLIGLQGAVYSGTFEGKTEYIFITRGTSELVDGPANVNQLLGNSGQYLGSVLHAQSFTETYENISFGGHSLGGGLASANALATNGKAVTFNAAAISSLTKNSLKLDDSNANITAYVVEGEIVDYSQRLIGRAEGNIVDLPASYPDRPKLSWSNAHKYPKLLIKHNAKMIKLRTKNHMMETVLQHF
jgi:RHS repeat-associated protein